MDSTTEYLSDYACRLTYQDLAPEVIQQVIPDVGFRLRKRRPVATRGQEPPVGAENVGVHYGDVVGLEQKELTLEVVEGHRLTVKDDQPALREG